MKIKEALPNVRDGEVIKTIVKATAGKTKEVEHTVVYKADSTNTATFKCHGTTLHYKCEDEDEVYDFNVYEKFAYYSSRMD